MGRIYTEPEVFGLLAQAADYVDELVTKQAKVAGDDVAALRAQFDQVVTGWRELHKRQEQEIELLRARCEDLTEENFRLSAEVESRVRQGL